MENVNTCLLVWSQVHILIFNLLKLIFSTTLYIFVYSVDIM